MFYVCGFQVSLFLFWLAGLLLVGFGSKGCVSGQKGYSSWPGSWLLGFKGVFGVVAFQAG